MMFDNLIWFWLFLGFFLIAAEMFIPSTFIIWFGISAILTAILAYFSINIAWQVLFFSVVAMVFLFFVRSYIFSPSSDKQKDEGSSPINDRARRYLGNTVTLKDDLIDGRGRISIEDTSWLCQSKDGSNITKGKKVKIVDISSTVFIIEEINE